MGNDIQSERRGKQQTKKSQNVTSNSLKLRDSSRQIIQQSDFIPEKEIYQQKLWKVSRQKMKGFHKYIGALTFQLNFRIFGNGSAILISKNLILTAAHNIYDRQLRQVYTNFKFYLSPYGVTQEFYDIQPGFYKYPKEFETCSEGTRVQHEYAIMKLKRDVEDFGEQNPFLPLQMTCYDCCPLQTSSKISIFGYPFHHNYQDFKPHDEEARSIELYQYGLTKENTIQQILENGRLTYMVSTASGQSGAPIICNQQIIGLHLGGAKGDHYNVGRYISHDVIENLQLWRQELNGYHFSVKPKDFCKHVPSAIFKVMKPLSYERSQDYCFDITGYASLTSTMTSFSRQSSTKQKKMTQLEEQKDLRIIGSSEVETKVRFEANFKGLREIDLTCFLGLKELSLVDNNIESIDLRENLFLKKLWLGKNKLSTIDFSCNTRLTYIGLSDNQIRQIDLSENRSLRQLYLNNNLFVKLDLSGNKQISILQVEFNDLKSLSVWYSKQLSLKIGCQRSEGCEICSFVQRDEVVQCRMKAEEQIKDLSNNKHNSNLYNCPYRHRLEIVD